MTEWLDRAARHPCYISITGVQKGGGFSISGSGMKIIHFDRIRMTRSGKLIISDGKFQEELL